jgi:hypothetical protein
MPVDENLTGFEETCQVIGIGLSKTFFLDSPNNLLHQWGQEASIV